MNLVVSAIDFASPSRLETGTDVPSFTTNQTLTESPPDGC